MKFPNEEVCHTLCTFSLHLMIMAINYLLKSVDVINLYELLVELIWSVICNLADLIVIKASKQVPI